MWQFLKIMGLPRWVVCVSFIGFSIFFGCQTNPAGQIPPKALNGVLDLSNWNFSKDGPVDLSGEWEFYWNQLIGPAGFGSADPLKRTGLLELPRAWNDYAVSGEPLSGDGFATFRLRVRLNMSEGHFALGLIDVGTAYNLFVNKTKVSAAGNVASSSENASPGFSKDLTQFRSETDTLEIILQVSNFHHRLGGPWESIRLGKFEQVLRSRERSLALDLFLCGSILIFSLYHLCLYFLRKKDRSLLYFSVFCFLIAFRLLATGNRYLTHIIADIPWEIVVKIEYLTFYLAVPLFATFSHSLFYREISIKFIRTIQFLSLLFSGIVLVTPAHFYSQTVLLYQLITLLSCLYGFYALVLSLRRKREGAVLFTLGFVILFFTVVNDIWYSRMIIHTGYVAPLGIFIFIFFQAFILSRRFSMAFSTVETQSIELLETNKAYWQEINERERIQHALQEAYIIINRSPAVAFLWKNLEGWPVEFVSDNVSEWFGYTSAEFMQGKISYNQVIHPDDLNRVAMEVKTYSKDEDRTVFVHEPYRIVAKEGAVRWLDDRTFIRRGPDGSISHFEGIVVDITDKVQAAEELKQSKEKLARSKKMESLGLLAGGVAHDLNNVLTGIVSYPDLLLIKMSEDSPYREYVNAIKASGDRAVAIVQDLITVARGVATAKEPLNLNHLVDDYIHSPEHHQLMNHHAAVKLATENDPELFNILGSQVHIRKVIMNLVANAAEAIAGNGHIRLATTNRYVDSPLKGYDDIAVGEYVVLSISDDGIGISPEDLERVFEPFYTKKVMGRSGTGLGLAVVWNVMQDHNGYINISSTSAGTRFELFFPITREKISQKNLSVPITDLQGRSERILVVDDEENQRDISCKMLDSLGYVTESVASGEEAVSYMEKNTVDLIVLDMIMNPGINGCETYERIIKISPKQKAIIVSGFAETDDVKRAQQLGAGQFIKKPLTLERIGLAVKSEIGK